MNDMFRAALIALCKAEGGHKNVADKVKSNPDYLKQIISGTALPSKRARSVFPMSVQNA